ncbi:MAG: PLP-dependent aminotransferase family protein [Paraglaciecola sp.]|uniref:MocR-like pyridoxine biosynthesis transcription factor PdxR n=1 Tax=Paraglaciecola sp. TaxID=1920173 RepID=UPI003297B650
MFKLQNVNSTQPKYLQLAETVREAIKQGQLTSGDHLPSVKSISQDLGLNRHTVMKSLAELVAEGWIASIQRVGYKVVENLPIEKSQNPSFDTVANSPSPIDYRLVRSGMPLPTYPANDFEYNFAGGQPDLTLFPFDEFKRCMSDVLNRPNIAQLSYGQSAGTPELLEQVKIYLRKSRAITDREIVVTNGSQEALFMVAQLLLKSGDKVAVEALGYPPAMAAFRSSGAELVGVKHDIHGMCPQDLEKQISKGNVRLIYLTPLHQYPTTVTLTVSRRMAIYQLAALHKIPIVEDDYDHEFHYRCQPLAPMATQDPSQLVIYISTFSKIMFPGARIGIMAVTKTMAKAVAEYRLLICHKSNVLMQSALAKWMDSGGFERHLRRTTRFNLQRRDHAISVLKKYPCFEFISPDGGMALWVRLIRHPGRPSGLHSAEQLAIKCQQLGIYIQHERQFLLDKSRDQDGFIRIGFASMNETNFATGIEKLVECLHLKI